MNGFTGLGWHPEQAVNRETALKMLTQWAAYAAFEERDRGTIEVGKYADFTVVSKDIMTIPLGDVLKVQILRTVVGGQTAYSSVAGLARRNPRGRGFASNTSKSEGAPGTGLRFTAEEAPQRKRTPYALRSHPGIRIASNGRSS
jgi:hypothetical protein